MSLNVHKDDTLDLGGWIEIIDDKDGGGALLTLNVKTCCREVEIGRGSSDQICPMYDLEQWLYVAEIGFGSA